LLTQVGFFVLANQFAAEGFYYWHPILAQLLLVALQTLDNLIIS